MHLYQRQEDFIASAKILHQHFVYTRECETISDEPRLDMTSDTVSKGSEPLWIDNDADRDGFDVLFCIH
jgi:hypothetical protein